VLRSSWIDSLNRWNLQFDCTLRVSRTDRQVESRSALLRATMRFSWNRRWNFLSSYEYSTNIPKGFEESSITVFNPEGKFDFDTVWFIVVELAWNFPAIVENILSRVLQISCWWSSSGSWTDVLRREDDIPRSRRNSGIFDHLRGRQSGEWMFYYYLRQSNPNEVINKTRPHHPR